MMNLLDLDPAALAQCFAERGEKPFRARQVSRWVHQRFADDVHAMTDLAEARCANGSAAEAAIVAARGDRATRRPPTARASGCSTPAAATPSRPSTSPRTTAARCASRRRPAARSTARSARPASRASTATSRPARSSASCGTPTARCSPTASPRRGSSRPRADHQRRDDGHGRAARELRQRRAGAAR